MPGSLASRIRAYAAMVEQIPVYDEWMEVSSALVWRDMIQEALAAKVPLLEDIQALLKEADKTLIRHRDLIAERFPEVFEERGAPESHWWWHLEHYPSAKANLAS